MAESTYKFKHLNHQVYKGEMNTNFSKTDFYRELESSLATSTGEQRKNWAATIIEKDLSLEALTPLLQNDQKVASRFLWLLSDVGISSPDKLRAELPVLFDVCERLHPDYKNAFASFWLYAGVPAENEGQAIDLLFNLIQSNDTNITIKSRALLVLSGLAKKYPELKNELRICIDDQCDNYSNDFRKRAIKIRKELE